MRKLKLSQKQVDRASEIVGNIAVAWFSAGAISPIFVRPKSVFEFLISFGVSLVMTGFFFTISLYLIRSKK